MLMHLILGYHTLISFLLSFINIKNKPNTNWNNRFSFYNVHFDLLTLEWWQLLSLFIVSLQRQSNPPKPSATQSCPHDP